jgi:hypothetical protein
VIVSGVGGLELPDPPQPASAAAASTRAPAGSHAKAGKLARFGFRIGETLDLKGKGNLLGTESPVTHPGRAREGK